MADLPLTRWSKSFRSVSIQPLFPCQHISRAALRLAIPALVEAERIIIWPGGIWDWTDPLIAIEAMRINEQRLPGIHLVFFAGRHPGEGHADASIAGKARALAQKFHLADRTVHFIDDYVPYEKRGQFLAGCDAGISNHRANLESHFAYRTRLFDCLWAALPIVCTEGDVLSELVVRHELGIVVPAADASSLAHAIERICDADFAAGCRARIIAVRASFNWKDAVEPLARFCEEPRITHVPSPIADAWALAQSGWRTFRKSGAEETWRRLKHHLRNR